jgi:hypothetical protein
MERLKELSIYKGYAMYQDWYREISLQGNLASLEVLTLDDCWHLDWIKCCPKLKVVHLASLKRVRGYAEAFAESRDGISKMITRGFHLDFVICTVETAILFS